ncbi:MAG TPA: Gfo/Idh/MocA family oxidoreductase, partial [Candidatus Thermoplasmatota archaeon]|nr:Gfo/Idh/MocA family oxidoreductase [Candidatus Thermoplasmatota archaeon]
MRLGIIGCGAIGTDVGIAADAMEDIEKIYLHDINPVAAKKLCSMMKKASIQPVEDFLKDVDVVFEAASQQAVTQYAAMILEAGKDVIIMSIGSLFNDTLRKKLENTAKKQHRKIYLPSGAVCGIDGVLAASIEKLDSVTLVTTKP